MLLPPSTDVWLSSRTFRWWGPYVSICLKSQHIFHGASNPFFKRRELFEYRWRNAMLVQ
jgi:hypothetical protein